MCLPLIILWSFLIPLLFLCPSTVFYILQHYIQVWEWMHLSMWVGVWVPVFMCVWYMLYCAFFRNEVNARPYSTLSLLLISLSEFIHDFFIKAIWYISIYPNFRKECYRINYVRKLNNKVIRYFISKWDRSDVFTDPIFFSPPKILIVLYP